MSSGARSIVVNTSERAVSPDINRLQALGTKGYMEALRWLLDVNQGIDDDQAGATATEYTTAGTPMRGEVLGGLTVVPQVGLLGLGIANGVALVIDPDATPTTDDSAYKYVADPGGLPICYRTAGAVALAMTANSSGSTRIDVVEVTRIQDPAPETDVRDIFNPTTQLYTATSVTKTTGSTFQYRVRAGTPGAGFPGVVTEWMPLAVASVPTGTTSNDTITFWDVRPLVNDRVLGMQHVSQSLPRRTKLLHSVGGPTGAYPVSGIVECTSGEGYRRLGGTLRRGSPGTDYLQNFVDFLDSANQESGFSLSGTGLAYFYLLTPFGLPRWARYTDVAAGSRVPRSPRGIPIMSATGPDPVYGTPSAAIEFPAVFGFDGATTTDGVCWGATVQFGSGPHHLAYETTCDGWTVPLTTVAIGGTWTPGSPGSGALALIENVAFPAGATRVRVLLQITLTETTGGPQEVMSVGFVNGIEVTLADSPTSTAVVSVAAEPKIINMTQATGSIVLALQWLLDIELPSPYPQITNTPLTYNLAFELSSLNVSQPSQMSFATLQANVVAFKYE